MDGSGARGGVRGRVAAVGRAALLLALADACPSAAQAPPDSALADSMGVVALPGLTVGALRTALPLARAPYALSQLGADRLREARPGLALDEALRQVPGVQVDNRYNYAQGERISIRGFGARAQFGVRGVKVLLDGIPATLPDGQSQLSHLDLSTLAAAEVLRGPASALYGNAAGGVLLLHTQQPPDARLAQRLRFTAGADGLRRWHGTTGGHAGATRYQLLLSRLSYGGYRHYSAAENRYLGLRLGWERGPDLLQLLVNGVRYDAQNPGSLPDSTLQRDRTAAWPNNLRQHTGEAGRQLQAGVRWRRAAGGSELEVAGYALGREIDNPIPVAVIDLQRRAGGVRALLHSATTLAGRELRWAAGTEAELQHDDRRNFQNQAGQRGTLTLSQEERVLGAGAFLQLFAALTPRLDALASLRYDRVRFSAADRLVSTTDPDDSGRRAMRALSPALGVSFRATPALSLYANLATAFETPTTTELANRPTGAGGFNPGLQPQRTLSLEAGLKGGRGGALAYELAAYRARVRDALIPFEVPGTPERAYFRNAGSAVHRGVEAALRLEPGTGPRARLAYSYTDARFGSYLVGQADHRGNRLPGIAPHRLEAAAGWRTPSGWLAEVEARWLGAMPTDDANRARSPAYSVVDLRAGGAARRWHGLAVQPFVGVTNLLGRDYNASVVVNAFGGRYYEPAPGRALYAGVEVRLGERLSRWSPSR